MVLSPAMLDRVANCRILEEIGSGGMSVVYKAIQEPLGRTVAVKMLKASIGIDGQFAQRFEREATFMASLQHENILHVHDFVRDERGMFIVLEYVQGVDLASLLEKTRTLPVDIATIVALEVARALEYAHFRGIVHRDVKPANIMVSLYGEVKLMDFGVAGEEANLDPGEASAAGIGSPNYMSPEQILGDRLDARSDVFSLGIVLYEMLTGKKPFVEDEGRSVMQKIRLDRYTPPRKLNPDIPIELERILARAMQKLPANRYPSMQPLVQDLMEFLAPRTAGGYGARLVSYLRDIELLPGAKADEILSLGVGRSGKATRTQSRALLWRVAAAEFLVGLLVVGTGFVIQKTDGRFDARARAAATQPVEQRPEGYLAVTVDPWAEVIVDGVLLATTPFARPLALPPGTHYVRLRNPHFGQHDERVEIVAGQTARISLSFNAENPSP